MCSTIIFNFNLNAFSFTARRIHAIVFETARTKSVVLHVQFNDSKFMFPSTSEQFNILENDRGSYSFGEPFRSFPYNTSFYQNDASGTILVFFIVNFVNFELANAGWEVSELFLTHCKFV